MKKMRARILTLLVCMFSVSNTCYANSTGKVTIAINGIEQSIPADLGEVFVNNGNTYVPLAFVAKKLGHQVDWSSKTQQITIDNKIILTINSKTVKTPSGTVTMNSVPIVKGGRTYVPIRFVSETLGYEVGYKNVAGKNCVLISGKANAAGNNQNNSISVSDVPTYDWSERVNSPLYNTNKYFVGTTFIGSNSHNSIIRSAGMTWEQERIYLSNLFGNAGFVFAKDGQMTLGAKDSSPNTGMSNTAIAVYSKAGERQVSIRGWVTSSNANPGHDAIVGQNMIIETLKYYSNSLEDGLMIYSYLHKAFSSHTNVPFDVEMTFGTTTVKFSDPGKFGVVVYFTAN